LNGCLAPLLIGTAVGTFFTGSDFLVKKSAVGDIASPVISRWDNAWHGLEAVANPFNVEFGLMVMFLAVCLGALYMINNIDDNELRANLRRNLMICFGGFLLMLVIVLVQIVTMEGFAVDADGVVTMEKGKYFHNLIQMPAVLILFLLGLNECLPKWIDNPFVDGIYRSLIIGIIGLFLLYRLNISSDVNGLIKRYMFFIK
jgi:cytochrome d ubiquinol oxidase subunit II